MRIKPLCEGGISLVIMSLFRIVPIVSTRETSIRKREKQRENEVRHHLQCYYFDFSGNNG